MNRRRFLKIFLIIIIFGVVAVLGYVALSKKSNLDAGQDLPTTCLDETEGDPVITHVSSYYGQVGDNIEIEGCNFAGFEGDKNAWIENSDGVKGILYGKEGSTSKLLKITLESPLCQKDNSYSGLPCDDWLQLEPGKYQLYTMPWGEKSNVVMFTVK